MRRSTVGFAPERTTLVLATRLWKQVLSRSLPVVSLGSLRALASFAKTSIGCCAATAETKTAIEMRCDTTREVLVPRSMVLVLFWHGAGWWTLPCPILFHGSVCVAPALALERHEGIQDPE
jgi:hypothetical protein